MTWSWRQADLARLRRPWAREGSTPRRVAPRDPAQAPRPTRPDRLVIWPAEDERFGIDVLYLGPQGARRAGVVQRQLEAAGLVVALREEAGDGWTVRFGPVGREEMVAVLNGYVW